MKNDYKNIIIKQKMKVAQLAIMQLDKQLVKWKRAKTWFQPKNGWIKVIRKTLGLTTNQLASRLKVDRSRIIRIESDEARAALTMKTLAAVADALNCDFVYAFIPKKNSLKQIVEQQAYKVASQQLTNISHNMSLEKQALTARQNKKQIEELKNKLLEKSFKKIWKVK